MVDFCYMGLFFRKQETPAAEQVGGVEGTVDFDRLLELASGDLQEDIETLRGGILMNGGSFTPEDQKIVERFATELTAVAVERAMPADKAAVEAALRLYLIRN